MLQTKGILAEMSAHWKLSEASLISTLDIAEETISELEGMSTETSKLENKEEDD